MVAMSSETLHATSVAIGGRAVMIAGPSGAGKSDLALRLIDRGAVLVSDDYTLVRRVDGRLLASPPASIEGRMEVRGIGVVAQPFLSDIPVAMIAELADEVERMPVEPASRSVAGMDVPVVRIVPHEASAPIKLELALAHLDDGGGPRTGARR